MTRHGNTIRSLKTLRAAETECTRCPLYKYATQVVPGQDSARARLMLVGEQPGDREDIAGKHFKFEPRGKRRLHKRPNVYEIERCKWWNDIEESPGR